MNLLDKISVLEANTVTKEEFQETWGMTREEYLNEMKKFIEEQQAEEE